MKKIVALALALCLLSGVVAYADLTADSPTASTTVSYTITAKDEYTVVIPPAITIDSETKTGAFTVNVLAGAELVTGNELNIKLMSTTNNFKLTDEAGNAIAYTVKRGTLTPWSSNSDLGTTGKVLMSVYSFPTTVDMTSDTITITAGTGGPAGTYSDQLNFAVSISTRPGT